jgi:hypothetical protein
LVFAVLKLALSLGVVGGYFDLHARVRRGDAKQTDLRGVSLICAVLQRKIVEP